MNWEIIFVVVLAVYFMSNAWLLGNFLAELIYAGVQNVMLEEEIKRLRGLDDKQDK